MGALVFLWIGEAENPIREHHHWDGAFSFRRFLSSEAI